MHLTVIIFLIIDVKNDSKVAFYSLKVTSTTLSHLILRPNLRGRFYCPHYSDEEMESQGSAHMSYDQENEVPGRKF